MNTMMLAGLLAMAGPAKGEAAQRAEAAFDAGDYETAATAAAEAYVVEGDPVYLYVQAQAERFGDHCEVAVDHYREFIEAVPPGPAADAARDNIAECEQVLASASGPVPAPSDSVEPGPADQVDVGVEPGPADPVDSSPPRRWYQDTLGGVLVGTGVVALGVGGGLYGVARADERAAAEAADVVTYGERIDRAFTLSRVAIPVMAVGGGLVVAGVIRWAVLGARGRRPRSERASLRPGGVSFRF